MARLLPGPISAACITPSAEAAESELRDVLVLKFLAGKAGETFEGVITGVTNFGVFVQLRQFLIEGLVRLANLGDDWWDVSARYGQITGQRSGRKYRIGDILTVQIVRADAARRQLDLVPVSGDQRKKIKAKRRRAK